MTLTKEVIQKNIWKRDCLLFLILAFTLPLLTVVLVVFDVKAFLFVAPMVFIPLMIAFCFGLKKLIAIKRNDFYVVKHSCTNIRTETYTVDNSDGKSRFAVFGNYGEYKLKESHSEFVSVGSEYYIVILTTNSKIVDYYGSKKCEVDKNQFYSEDGVVFYYHNN